MDALSHARCSGPISQTTNPIAIMERVVVLGTGWAGYQCMKLLRLPITCVAKNNHFLFTPLLPPTTVGTLEFRNVAEPTLFLKRSKAPGDFSFLHAEALDVDFVSREVVCRSFFSVAQSEDVSVPRVYPQFRVPYSKLVIAVGAQAATFGIPGVSEYTLPLRQLSDARLIRQRLVQVFERASSPYTDPKERERLLHTVIVGGGPTSIEFAAELYDFLQTDGARLFPDLVPLSKVTLVEASPRVLGTFSQSLSDYTMRLFLKRNVELRLSTGVKSVHAHHMELSDGSSVEFGLAVWSTGNAPVPFVTGLPVEKDKSGRIIVDEYLRVPGHPDVYAIGDASAERERPRAPTAQVAAQEGKYVAHLLNGKTNKPFRYQHSGMLAYVGGARALVDLPQVSFGVSVLCILLSDLDQGQNARFHRVAPVELGLHHVHGVVAQQADEPAAVAQDASVWQGFSCLSRYALVDAPQEATVNERIISWICRAK